MKGLMNMLISFTEKNSFKGEVVIEKPETRNKEILE